MHISHLFNWFRSPRALARWLVPMILTLATHRTFAAPAPLNVKEKDLAIALAHTSRDLIKATEGIGAIGSLLPRPWYETLHKAYLSTPVGDAWVTESRYEDWQLVAARIVPCEPMSKSPLHEIDRYCWPEVRLVWQPIQRKIYLNGRYLDSSADDRAIHAIYPLRPEHFLPAREADSLRQLLKKIDDYPLPATPFAPLNPEELKSFESKRDALSRQLLAATLLLRAPSIPETDYQGLGLRPETFLDRPDFLVFKRRLEEFLTVYAAPSELKLLTSFSLPPGRDPVASDEWIFLRFTAQNAVLKPDAIQLYAPSNGRRVGPALTQQRGSMRRDDDAFYEDSLSVDDQKEIAANVMLWATDLSAMSPRLADRSQSLVPNTSCVSCHKLNALRFDFHNFSYLEDQEITISPRVVRDVQLDLAWIKLLFQN